MGPLYDGAAGPIYPYLSLYIVVVPVAVAERAAHYLWQLRKRYIRLRTGAAADGNADCIATHPQTNRPTAKATPDK